MSLGRATTLIWPSALAASAGVLIVEAPIAGWAVAVVALLAGLAALFNGVPAPALFCYALVVSSAADGLVKQIHFGRFSATAALTAAYAFVGLLLLIPLRPVARRRLPPAVLLLGVLTVYGLFTLGWRGPSITGTQNVLVLLVFVTGIVAGARIPLRDAADLRAITVTYNLAALTALGLYAASVVLGGLGSNSVIGARSFALFAVVVIAWTASGWRYRQPWAAPLTCVTLALILLSLSRTAFVAALIVASLAWLNTNVSLGWMRMFGTLLVAIAVGYIAVSHVHAFHSRFYTGDVQSVASGVSVNLEGRATLWSETWHSFLGSPYFGHGAGDANNLIARLSGGVTGETHNDYLRLLNDYGLLGTFLWLAAYLGLVKRVWRAWQDSLAKPPQEDEAAQAMEGPLKNPAIRRIHAAAFASLVGLALAMITDNPIEYVYVMGPIAVLVGLSLNLARPKSVWRGSRGL